MTEEEGKVMALTALAENFGAPLSPALLAVWLDLLASTDAATVGQAVRKVMREYAFKTMPPFAVLAAALDGLTGQGEAAKKREALAAWDGLLFAISHIGPHRDPDLPARTARVLRLMGGWASACEWETRSLDFKRRDFLALWADCPDESPFALEEEKRAALEAGRRQSGGPGEMIGSTSCAGAPDMAVAGARGTTEAKGAPASSLAGLVGHLAANMSAAASYVPEAGWRR